MAPTNTSKWCITGQTGFDALKFIESAPIPSVGPFDVLVHMHYASLNYRDLIIPKGQYPFPMRENVVPGSDGAGTVVSVGKDVSRFKEGDKVLTQFGQRHQFGPVDAAAVGATLGGGIDGVLSEYAVFNETGLVRMPESLSFQQGSTLPCAALTAWNALYGLQSKAIVPGQWVLTEGTGGVSVFAIQVIFHDSKLLAVAENADLCCSSPKRLAAVLSPPPLRTRRQRN